MAKCFTEEPVMICSTVLATSTALQSRSTEGAEADTSSICSPPRTTTVCACFTPASSRLCTRRTGPTRKTVLSDWNISTTLMGGGVAERMMIGCRPGRKGCRSVRRNATTCGQTEPPVTTRVTREGSERSSWASFASRERTSRSMSSSFSSSPKLEFSLMARWNGCIEAVERWLLDLVIFRGVLAGCTPSSRVRLICLRLLSCRMRLLVLDVDGFMPWPPSSRW
mmetsp:Transcript_99145/g.263473  ORF Transcript_99145/g.263473 Transcript_99145/m.263473 type:complete len:224 (+) Transcript_99145:287-958(+)